ncbi:MAG TPA: ParB N-terminal domain-containing protein [Vicinamibacterales bacterium]|nr:ParB N-terminal domain-containing protein [Vicinamibacterales bacterium]
MPEFEAWRTSVPPFSASSRRNDDADGEVDAPAAAPQREGLPPGFRMRHDAHYVDQLTSRGPTPHVVRTLPVRDIEPPHGADLQDLEPLVRSIAAHGVLEPLLVRPRNGRFELLAGARRLRAAALAGLSDVPCLVHPCDEDRARALREAAALRRTPPQAAPARQPLPSAAIDELRRSFGTIGSCLHLMVERSAALRDRVALDLIRTETHRAHRLVQAIHVLTQEPAVVASTVSLRSLVEEVLDAFEPERRLSAAQISLEYGDDSPEAWGDRDWIAAALSGAISAMLALVQGTRAPALDIRLVQVGSVIRFEIAQRAVTVPEWVVSRFFDQSWTDRPGGYACAVELAAARHAGVRLGGSLELLAADRGGCRLVVTLPAAVNRRRQQSL